MLLRGLVETFHLVSFLSLPFTLLNNLVLNSASALFEVLLHLVQLVLPASEDRSMAAGAKEERENGLAGDLARHLPHQPRQLRPLCCRVAVHHEVSSVFCRRTFAGKQFVFQEWIQDLEFRNKNLSEKTSVGRIIVIHI